jgi:hypothetical protein
VCQASHIASVVWNRRSWGLVAVRHAHEGLANSVKTMATAVGFDGRTFLEGPGHKAPRGLPSPITESDIPPFLRELYVNGAPAMVHFMVCSHEETTSAVDPHEKGLAMQSRNQHVWGD